MKAIPLLFLFFSFTALRAQEVVQTAWDAQDFMKCVRQNGTTSLTAGTPAIQWRRAVTSFSAKGIDTFLGYAGGQLVATASCKGETVRGEVWQKDCTLRFRAAEPGNGPLMLERVACDALHCGACGSCDELSGSCKGTAAGSLSLHGGGGLTPCVTVDGSAPPVQQGRVSENTGRVMTRFQDVVRTWRLALPVSFYRFENDFHSSTDEVRAFWAEAEALLNEYYAPTLNLTFRVVDADTLIVQTAEEENLDNYPSSQTAVLGTGLINRRLGSSAYDCGLLIGSTTSTNVGGMTQMNCYYTSGSKAHGWSTPTLKHVAHEMGHGFGSLHTFGDASWGTSSMWCEHGNGQSIMSYGDPRDFFSLPSIQVIQQWLTERCSYWVDEAHTALAGESERTNNAFGRQTGNRPPVLDTTAIRREYTLPTGTYFGFHLRGTDPDGDALSFYLHPADIQKDSDHPLDPAFGAVRPSRDGFVRIQQEWSYLDYVDCFWPEDFHTFKQSGTYHFWLGVSDEKPYSETIDAPHATGFDLAEVAVHVVYGTAFKFYGTAKDESYRCGTRLPLRWYVDQGCFADTSRVRISLSTDMGQTFPYVLAYDAPNSGEAEVILPQDTIGHVSLGSHAGIRGGVIKVEVLDHIAYALTCDAPVVYNASNPREQTPAGGFLLTESPIRFSPMPEHLVFVPDTLDRLPEPPDVKAWRGEEEVSVEFAEAAQTERVVQRVWKATDAAGNVSEVEQIVVREAAEEKAGAGEEDPGTLTAMPCTPHAEGAILHQKGSVLTLEGLPDGTRVQIHRADGRRVASRGFYPNLSLNLPARGIYLVTAAGRTWRVAW